MHMAPLERLHDNPWHSNTNGPSIPPPVVPALPAVPVPQPTGPPSDAEFEMLQTRIQSMDPILVWNLVRIKILPNFSPWDFLCDRTRLCGPKLDQNTAGAQKLPTSVSKLKFLLQEMNDLAEELSHLVDSCCDVIDDTDIEEDSEVPDEMIDDIDEEGLSETEKKPVVVDGETKDDEKETEEKTEDETKKDGQENEKEEKPVESTESAPIETEADPKPDVNTETTATETTPTTNGVANASENSTDSTSNDVLKEDAAAPSENNVDDKNTPSENNVESVNLVNEEEEAMEEENKVNIIH